MTKKRKILLFILSVIVLFIAGMLIGEIILRGAERTDYGFEFDGKRYETVSHWDKIDPFNGTWTFGIKDEDGVRMLYEIDNFPGLWNVVCKTNDGVWTLYKINHFPELEYVAARTSAWEAEILKRVG